MFPAKRSFPIVPLPVDGGTSDYQITRGMVMAGVMISVLYAVNVTTAGAAVRSRSLPIRRISLIGDNGKTIQAWLARDLISMAQIFEQTPIGGLLTPASGFAIANYTALEAHVPLQFIETRAKAGEKTALPSFAYQNLTLRIEWGSVTDLLTGTPVGPITFTAAGATVTQLDYADLVIRDAAAVARALRVNVSRYVEVAASGVAQSGLELDLGTTADIRGILIASEVATGELANTIVSAVTMKEDNTLSVFQSVPWASLRADNAKHFGMTLPAGLAVIDFAEDGDIDAIYRATTKNKVKLLFDVLAVAGTIRAALLTIEPPLRV